MRRAKEAARSGSERTDVEERSIASGVAASKAARIHTFVLSITLIFTLKGRYAMKTLLRRGILLTAAVLVIALAVSLGSGVPAAGH